MRPPVRLFVAVGAVVVVAVVVLIAALNSGSRPVLTSITGIQFSQSTAVAGFSKSTHRTTDPARIAAFAAVVKKYSIDVTDFDQTLNDVCTGGLATAVTLEFADSKTAKLRIYDCGRIEPRGTFVSDASTLFARWASADGG